MRVPNHRWLRFAITSGLALAVWGLALAHGYGWAMIWLPAMVAGAAWPRQSKRTLDQCRMRVLGRHSGQG